MENRKRERIKSLLRATILFNQRTTTVDCVVKNISPSGAKIAIDPVIAVPTDFELDLPTKGKTYRAKMRRRDKESAGIEFVDQLDQRDPGNAQFQQLLAENIRLKAAVQTLAKRLEDIGQDVPNFF